MEKCDNIMDVKKFWIDVLKQNREKLISLIKTENNLITEMDEYWADDTEVPEWRRKMNIGRKV